MAAVAQHFSVSPPPLHNIIKVQQVENGTIARLSYLFDDEVVGVIEGNLYGYHVHVDPLHRCKGIGTTLLRAFTVCMGRRFLSTVCKMDGAMCRVFEKAGFQRFPDLEEDDLAQFISPCFQSDADPVAHLMSRLPHRSHTHTSCHQRRLAV